MVWANEEFGGGFGRLASLRTEGPKDIPPVSLLGVETVGNLRATARAQQPACACSNRCGESDLNDSREKPVQWRSRHTMRLKSGYQARSQGCHPLSPDRDRADGLLFKRP